jgi:anti-sigma B factor antagonist
LVGQFHADDVETSECVLVTLHGELDLATAPLLRARLTELISTGHHRLVVDFGPLDFVDASGLTALTVAAGMLRDRDGWVHLVGVSQHTRRVLRILQLTRDLPAYGTFADAVGRPATCHSDGHA